MIQGTAIKFLIRTVTELPHLTKAGRNLLRATVLRNSFRLFGEKERQAITHEFPVCIYQCEKCGRYSFIPFETIVCECEQDSVIGAISFRPGMKEEHDDFWYRWALKHGFVEKGDGPEEYYYSVGTPSA